MTEYFFTCPHCWDKISMLIDTSISGQNYIEACEICCNPIEINYTTLENEIAYFDAKSIDQWLYLTLQVEYPIILYTIQTPEIALKIKMLPIPRRR